MDQEAGAIPTNIYGDVCLRKARKKRQKLLIVELFHDFANKTTLHGLRYIIDRSLDSIEKIFWLITFLMSVCMCFYLITQVWYKWKHSPVIVTVSEALVPVGAVPFPSVTICPQNKCKVDRFNYSYFDINDFNNTKTNKKYLDVSLVCSLDVTMYGAVDVLNTTATSNITTVNNIIDVAPTLQDVFVGCAWRGALVDCDKIFSTVLTAEGVCFNVNGLVADQMFRDDIQKRYNYTTRTSVDDDFRPYPRHGRGIGASPDLAILLAEERSNSDKLCNSVNSGYKIYVQHPADMPQSSVHYFAALHGSVSSLALSFSIMNTSESLRSYGADVRQCYYAKERPLRYFKTYTASNCRLECWTNFTYEHCGGYWFSMPHDEPGGDKICTLEQGACVMAVQDKLAPGEGGGEAGEGGGEGGIACGCLPACDSVEYDADVLKTEFNLKYYLNAKYENILNNSRTFSNINMYFKKPSFISMRRSELFGWVDFLANCGGLLGLFLGFSFLSLAEIFYFLTLRLCCTLKKDLQEERRSKWEKSDAMHDKRS